MIYKFGDEDVGDDEKNNPRVVTGPGESDSDPVAAVEEMLRQWFPDADPDELRLPAGLIVAGANTFGLKCWQKGTVAARSLVPGRRARQGLVKENFLVITRWNAMMGSRSPAQRELAGRHYRELVVDAALHLGWVVERQTGRGRPGFGPGAVRPPGPRWAGGDGSPIRRPPGPRWAGGDGSSAAETRGRGGDEPPTTPGP